MGSTGFPSTTTRCPQLSHVSRGVADSDTIPYLGISPLVTKHRSEGLSLFNSYFFWTYIGG
jgi:hypothetical protein